MNYSLQVIEVRQTGVFSDWFRRLRDEKARSRILIRIRRLSLGNFGDVKPVGNGVSELRIDYGPVTGSIFSNGEVCLFCCSPEAARRRNKPI